MVLGNLQQVQKLTSLLDSVVVNAYMANIEPTCSNDVSSVVKED